jgi:riboflavin synthase
MFTGLVEEVGQLTGIERLTDAARLTISGDRTIADASPGDSIAVNGICLTVIDVTGTTFRCDVMAETLTRSSLDSLADGDFVNLERATRADSRLGGHLVQGHVDGVGRIGDITETEHWRIIRITPPPELLRYIVEKGSVCVDGVSLTVASVTDDDFTVSLIPTTLRETTLGNRVSGDPVNIEVDIIGKYVEKLLAGYAP